MTEEDVVAFGNFDPKKVKPNNSDPDVERVRRYRSNIDICVIFHN